MRARPHRHQSDRQHRGPDQVDLGNFVRKAETELFTVFDLTRPEAVVDVPELDVERVSKKQQCTIRIAALADLAPNGHGRAPSSR